MKEPLKPGGTIVAVLVGLLIVGVVVVGCPSERAKAEQVWKGISSGK